MKTLTYDKENAGELREIIQRRGILLDEVMDTVKSIVSQVRERGDPALFIFTRKLDKFSLSRENIRVSEREVRQAYSRVDKVLVNALQNAANNIGRYHAEQNDRVGGEWVTETVEGILIREKMIPLKGVGCYIPGGRAKYPSSVLMTCLPAKAAGVERVAIVSPPPISDAVLIAADICGVKEIYRVGGAQAVAALAYGTESIPRVDKIVGPGNRYVTAAKKLVYGQVGVDMPAGPSEVLIMADDTARPGFIASDMLAQAEHDPGAQAMVVTSSREIADGVLTEVESQRRDLGGKELRESLQNSVIVITKDIDESIEFANMYAPEHLEIMTENPGDVAEKISNAGAVFLGDYSPVAAGDYASGGNHVLPTGGAARFASELSVRDFLRNMGIQEISREGLGNIRDTVEKIAEAEGFAAHKKSVSRRFG